MFIIFGASKARANPKTRNIATVLWAVGNVEALSRSNMLHFHYPSTLDNEIKNSDIHLFINKLLDRSLSGQGFLAC
jgi:hypothetical protein